MTAYEELGVYRKAFELLCEYLDDSGICVGCGTACPTTGEHRPCKEVIMECYLQTAREENE